MAITVFRILGGLRLGFAGQREHLADMVDVLLALFDGFGVGTEVVVTFRKTEAACAIERDDLVGIGKVLVGAHIEKCIHADGV